MAWSAFDSASPGWADRLRWAKSLLTVTDFVASCPFRLPSAHLPFLSGFGFLAECPTKHFATDYRSSLALAAACACWGLRTVITKNVLGSVSPITLLVTQLAVSAAGLCGACS